MQLLKHPILLVFIFLSFQAHAQQPDSTSRQPAQLDTNAPAGPNPAYKQKNQPEGKETNGQPERERFDIRKKMFVGGSASLGFRSNPYYGSYFNIGASPLLGFRLTKFLAVGPGLVYQYYSLGGNPANEFGYKGFAQISFTKSILGHLEHNVVKKDDFQVDGQGRVVDSYRRQVSTTLVGGGYRQMASDRFGMDLYILFPVNTSVQTYNSRSAPVIRAGFIYNLK